MRVAIIGTGYVGLTTGVTLAYVGHEVTCVDVDAHKLEKLRHGQAPIYRKGDGVEGAIVPRIFNAGVHADLTAIPHRAPGSAGQRGG